MDLLPPVVESLALTALLALAAGCWVTCWSPRPTVRRAAVEPRPGRDVSVHLVRLPDVPAVATPLAAACTATRGDDGAGPGPLITAMFGPGAQAAVPDGER